MSAQSVKTMVTYTKCIIHMSREILNIWHFQTFMGYENKNPEICSRPHQKSPNGHYSQHQETI